MHAERDPPELAAQGRVFDEPWEARAFALARALYDSGLFSAREWAQARQDEARAEADGPATPYKAWLGTLETLLVRRGLVGRDRLAASLQAWRAAAEATPHGQPVMLDGRE